MPKKKTKDFSSMNKDQLKKELLAQRKQLFERKSFVKRDKK